MLRQVRKVEQDRTGPNKLPQSSAKGGALLVLCVLVWAQGNLDEVGVSKDGSQHQLQAGTFLGS